MWDNDTFINYLRQVGLQDAWQNIIYPGMKKCLIGSLLATQGNNIFQQIFLLFQTIFISQLYSFQLLMSIQT